AGVNAGVKTAITGGSFKDNLISEAGSIAFNTIGHDLYNNSEYKDILPPKSVVQGLVGGALAKLQGGDFAAGAISTATSHVVSEYMLNSIIENFDPENPPFDINDKEAALKHTEQLKTQVTAISSLVGTIATKAVKPDISDQDLINSNDIAQNAVENNAVFLAGSIILALTLYANTPDVKEEPKTGLPNSALNPALDGAVFAYDVTKELIDGGVPTEAIIIALGHKLHISKSAAKKIVDDVKVGKTLSKDGKIANEASNVATYEKYKDDLAQIMGKPEVSDTKLQEYINKLYRENATIGSGSTADAVRYELTTGNSVGGKFHTQKAQESVTYLERWLNNNPNANFSDRQAVEHIIRDTKNALNGN
ncbi:MAG TPA: hypothetical protein CFH79_03440, partial [Sulfurospirillum sp. UBA11407]